MQVVYQRCCGIDIHKKLVVACLLVVDPNGQLHKQIRSFSTMTAALLELVDWLKAEECQIVAMESTGVYWKPLYNLLEGELEVWVVNAAHMKAVPGRKTDVKDSEWLAELLQHGLLKASFIPPTPQRELRELTRYRSSLVADRAQLINRLQKVLEDANVKLASVATDIIGVSGRDILSSLARGEDDPAVLAELARGRLRQRLAELKEALQGRVKAHHRFMLGKLLEQLEFYDEQISAFNAQIAQRLEWPVSSPLPPDEGEERPRPRADQDQTEDKAANRTDTGQISDRTKLKVVKQAEGEVKAELSQSQQALARLDTIPGINRRIGEIVLAEIGLDMRRFPSAGHLASWAGLCPGHNESGGEAAQRQNNQRQSLAKAGLY